MGVGGFTDCTFFNYDNTLHNGSDSHSSINRRNRFIRCGYGLYSHPIYVANGNSTTPEQGVLSEENIMVGCQGYSVHYYHEPGYGVAKYNFILDALYGLAIQGDWHGPVRGDRNILWGVANAPLYEIVSSGGADNNIWFRTQRPAYAVVDGVTFDSNRFVDVATNGTNPITWTQSDLESNIGNTVANIDSTVTALEASVDGKTTQQIHDDSTFEPNFAILKSVVDTWKTKP